MFRPYSADSGSTRLASRPRPRRRERGSARRRERRVRGGPGAGARPWSSSASGATPACSAWWRSRSSGWSSNPLRRRLRPLRLRLGW